MQEGRLIFSPNLNPETVAEGRRELESALDLAQELVEGYAEKGPENSRILCKKFLEHILGDRVGIAAFPIETLKDVVAVSAETISGRKKFLLMVSPLFCEQMHDESKCLEAEKQVILAIRDVVKEIDEAVDIGTPIMGNAEYQRLIALKMQSRN